LLPANAQWGNSQWGNSWGSRQQQPQQPYNPYGGYGHDRQWDSWGYRQRERAPSPRLRERVREVEKERPPDYSHAPPATPREDATVKIVVMGDANADWLAYGLEDAFSEKPEIGIVRKHRTDSGLIRYDQRRDIEWPQVAREIIATEKPNLVVMMIGDNEMPVALPVPVGSSPQAPNAKAGGPAQGPVAGPVVPLTETHIAPEELLGGAGTSPAAAGASVTGVLTKGEPLAAPSGRADDFSWPRGMVNVGPVAVEPAAPDSGAADAGAKSAKPAQGKSVTDAYATQTGRKREPAHRRAPPLTHHPSADERPNVSFFGSNGW